MKHHNKKSRFLVLSIGLAVCFSLMAVMIVGQAYAAEKMILKCTEPSQAQQMCPPKSPTPTCETSTCSVTIDCPAVKSPGKTTCQATIDCPAKPAKPEPKKK